jgi:hypothetical protein
MRPHAGTPQPVTLGYCFAVGKTTATLSLALLLRFQQGGELKSYTDYEQP